MQTFDWLITNILYRYPAAWGPPSTNHDPPPPQSKLIKTWITVGILAFSLCGPDYGGGITATLTTCQTLCAKPSTYVLNRDKCIYLTESNLSLFLSSKPLSSSYLTLPIAVRYGTQLYCTNFNSCYLVPSYLNCISDIKDILVWNEHSSVWDSHGVYPVHSCNKSATSKYIPSLQSMSQHSIRCSFRIRFTVGISLVFRNRSQMDPQII